MVLEYDILFVDEEVFGDAEEHVYDCECRDGEAIGTLADEEDKNAPEKIRITYPKIADILADEAAVRAVRRYRGLDASCEIHYGDIMLKYGEIRQEL